MGGPQVSDAGANVASTIALVLEQFIGSIRTSMPKIRAVYDEALSYETAVAKVRADNTEDSTSQGHLYPFIAFRRSVLRHSVDGTGQRAVSMRVRRQVTGTQSFRYVPVHGEFDVDFLYVTRSLEDLERFEVSYLSEEAFSGTKELIVNLDAELGGPLKYFVKHAPLADKDFSTQRNDYKQVVGKATIRGYYVVFEGASPHITSLVMNIRSFYNGLAVPGEGEILGTITVP